MASDVDICNSAIDSVGGDAIITLADDSKEADLCRRNFPLVRDEFLAAHFWNFAMKRIELALLPAAPLFEFSYSHQLPSDCIRVRQTDDNDTKFKIEGRQVVSDNSKVFIEYVSRVVDYTQYSPMAIEALSAKLAAKISYPITKSRTLSRDLHDLAILKVKDAWSVDGQEGDMDDYQEDVWLGSRIHGITGIGTRKVVP